MSSVDADEEASGGVDETLGLVVGFFRGTSSGEAAAIFRISVGLASLINSILLFLAFDRYYSESGLLPWKEVVRFPENAFSLLALAPKSDAYLHSLGWTLIIANVAYLLGFFARGASVVMALILVSLHHRNPYVLNGGDNLLLEYLWLGVLLPLDARFSVRRAWGWIQDVPSWIFGQRLIELLICYIYLYAFGAKMQHGVWLRGEAMLDVLASPMLARFPIHLDSRLISAVASYATLAFEALFPFLVLQKSSRRYALMIGVLFHLGIELTLKIPLFSAMMLSSYVLFLGDEEVRGLLVRFSPDQSRGLPQAEPPKTSPSVEANP